MCIPVPFSYMTDVKIYSDVYTDSNRIYSILFEDFKEVRSIIKIFITNNKKI